MCPPHRQHVEDLPQAPQHLSHLTQLGTQLAQLSQLTHLEHAIKVFTATIRAQQVIWEMGTRERYCQQGYKGEERWQRGSTRRV